MKPIVSRRLQKKARRAISLWFSPLLLLWAAISVTILGLAIHDAMHGHALAAMVKFIITASPFAVGVVTPHKIQGELAVMKFTPHGGAATQMVALTDWEIQFKVKSEDTTSNDDAGWETSLPGHASWTATAKVVYVEGSAAQNAIYGVASPNMLVPGIGLAGATLGTGLPSFSFFPEVQAASGENSYVGAGYISDVKITASAGKVVAADLTIQGSGPITPTAQ